MSTLASYIGGTWLCNIAAAALYYGPNLRWFSLKYYTIFTYDSGS